MKVSGEWFQNPATQAVFAMLNDAGYEAYMVGGCVRNVLIGAEVSDIDISTNATPEIVSKLAEKAGLRAIPTGIDHGTITVVAGGEAHEITTYRHDIETDGRRAVIAFADNMVDDARRRDFTMNALYADANGQVVDPLGGLSDLEDRVVRFIGTASHRIQEDYLRILRFFRFTAWYGDPAKGFDTDALAAIAENLAGIETLSKERLGHEMKKLLQAPDPSMAVAVMAQTGVLPLVLPGSDAKALPVLIHNEGLAAAKPKFTRRLAALGGEEPAVALRLSKSDAREVARLRESVGQIPTAQEAGYRLGAESGLDARLLHSALLETVFDPAEIEKAAFGAAQTCPVAAADLMGRFQGVELGAVLKRLESDWVTSGFTLSKDELMATL